MRQISFSNIHLLNNDNKADVIIKSPGLLIHNALLSNNYFSVGVR